MSSEDEEIEKFQKIGQLQSFKKISIMMWDQHQIILSELQKEIPSNSMN